MVIDTGWEKLTVMGAKNRLRQDGHNDSISSCCHHIRFEKLAAPAPCRCSWLIEINDPRRDRLAALGGLIP
jgi:hypothetical protein